MGLTLAEIFRQYGPAYRQKYAQQLLPSHLRAMRAIEQCRTAALGGQVYTCPQCERVEYRYHSCRNRHCPQCQNVQAQTWLEQQQQFLLPVPYFLLTFTLPAGLRVFARQRQRLVYAALFRASAAATQQLARDPRFIGGHIGMIGVLHTWTRDLRYHPHVHYLVPAGGLSPDGATWATARKNFFLPVKALSRLFRGQVHHMLGKATHLPASVWANEWVVHCKPVGTGQTALKYLAPYVFRVALSNRRLVKLDHDRVTFRYTASQTGQSKLCTLPVEAFIARFLQHVLPKSFVKIRYYGFFASGQRVRLAALRQHLASAAGLPPVTASPTNEPIPTAFELQSRNVGACSTPPNCCPVCGGPLQVHPLPRSPP